MVEAAKLDGEDLILPSWHECTKNHDGSLGAMEPCAYLDMVVELYDDKFQCITDSICCDDDLSTTEPL
jgi:hypothetical protein